MSISSDEIRLARAVITALDLRIGEWVPLPHQIPPAGDWYGWLLMAGRGAGKTDACANYMVQHTQGPPCLPGPVPHFMGIIAPTLADAATSGFSGPSGIRAHDPTARLSAAPGGTVVKWPNGSEAKLFGAHKPDDIERLRSGGNRCLAAGTLVETDRGPTPIEEVRIGDRVWTRNGLRRVLRTWDNGMRAVRKYEHAAGSTRMTEDHEVWTARGWHQAAMVEPTDTVFTWGSTENQFATTGSVGHRRETDTTETADEDYCTAGCGSVKSDQSRKDNRSTTGITFARTIASRTSSSSHPVSTGTSTEMNAGQTGIRAVGVQPGRNVSCVDTPASVAGWSSRHVRRRCSYSTAHRDAGISLLHHERSKYGCAACAVTGSRRRVGAVPVPVHESALRPTPIRDVARVYDLTVEHDHEFFADGLLVANCLVWLEELAAFRYLDDAWDQMRFGLRTGPNPHWIGSTTPKPRELIRKIAEGLIDDVTIKVTRGTTNDNPHLPEHIRTALIDRYAGTSLGAQELFGELIDQDENALWKRELIDEHRVGEAPGGLARVSVGVDPSGGAGEQGIVIVGKQVVDVVEKGKKTKQAHGYVLGDYSCRLPPDGWGRRAVQAALDFEADDILVETNFGGDMAVATIRGAADDLGVSIPIRTVSASRGKRVRAEPVAALSARGRWHHVGRFPELETQMCTWTPEADYSPDRLDAAVWPAWHQKLVTTGTGQTVGSWGGGALASTQMGGRRR